MNIQPRSNIHYPVSFYCKTHSAENYLCHGSGMIGIHYLP